MRRQLEQILGSPDFDASRRSREFLCFIVEETLAGRGEALTQATIATAVFDRKDDFDAMVDPDRADPGGTAAPVARAVLPPRGQAGPVRIELPKGSYVPAFHKRDGGVPRRAGEAAARTGSRRTAGPRSW